MLFEHQFMSFECCLNIVLMSFECHLNVVRMKEYNINPEDGVFGFGQLLGMSDHISFPLGQSVYVAVWRCCSSVWVGGVFPQPCTNYRKFQLSYLAPI